MAKPLSVDPAHAVDRDLLDEGLSNQFGVGLRVVVHLKLLDVMKVSTAVVKVTLWQRVRKRKGNSKVVSKCPEGLVFT